MIPNLVRIGRNSKGSMKDLDIIAMISEQKSKIGIRGS